MIVVRPSLNTDLAALVRVARACGLPDWGAQGWEHELTNPHAYLRLAANDEQVVGLALIWMVFDKAELAAIAVLPAYRRTGLGHRLMNQVLMYTREQLASSTMLEVRAGNLPAIAMYYAHGFAQIDRRKCYYKDGEDALIMQLKAEWS